MVGGRRWYVLRVGVSGQNHRSGVSACCWFRLFPGDGVHIAGLRSNCCFPTLCLAHLVLLVLLVTPVTEYSPEGPLQTKYPSPCCKDRVHTSGVDWLFGQVGSNVWLPPCTLTCQSTWRPCMDSDKSEYMVVPV